MSKRPPEVFNSDLHLPKWRQAVLWLLESGPGRGIITMIAVGLLVVPTIWLGLLWPGALVLAGISFALGWNSAWRKLKKDGFLSKL